MVEADSQLASRIHIRNIQCVWAHIYVVHWHTVAALNSYSPYFPQILGYMVTYVELKSCHYIMVEVDSNLKLLLAAILDMIYTAFEHIDMLPIGIQ